MKILITPMAVAAPTAGPISRARVIAEEAKSRGHDVAFCAADEINYKPVDGVTIMLQYLNYLVEFLHFYRKEYYR